MENVTVIRFDYDSGGALHHPDIAVTCVPATGDIVSISGVRHIVKEREFWIDHGLLEYVELHLEEE
jgi:hypothetical protein